VYSDAGMSKFEVCGNDLYFDDSGADATPTTGVLDISLKVCQGHAFIYYGGGSSGGIFPTLNEFNVKSETKLIIPDADASQGTVFFGVAGSALFNLAVGSYAENGGIPKLVLPKSEGSSDASKGEGDVTLEYNSKEAIWNVGWKEAIVSMPGLTVEMMKKKKPALVYTIVIIEFSVLEELRISEQHRTDDDDTLRVNTVCGLNLIIDQIAEMADVDGRSNNDAVQIFQTNENGYAIDVNRKSFKDNKKVRKKQAFI
jgi:hypothetical protein